MEAEEEEAAAVVPRLLKRKKQLKKKLKRLHQLLICSAVSASTNMTSQYCMNIV